MTDVPTHTPLNGAEAYTNFPVLTDGNLLVGRAALHTGNTTTFRGAVSTIAGEVQLVDPLPGDAQTEALDGNALGQIVGDSSEAVTGGSGNGGNNGGNTVVPSTDSSASRFARQGRAGYNSGQPAIRPIIWTASGGTTLLPTLPGFSNGYAQIINRDGIILGRAFSDTQFETKTVLWDNNQPRDLNRMRTTARGSLGTNTTLNYLYHISDTNYITASSSYSFPQYVLVPVTRKETP